MIRFYATRVTPEGGEKSVLVGCKRGFRPTYELPHKALPQFMCPHYPIHIYFEGTDPRHPGVPPQGPRGWVKTPREQFEDGLTVQEWYAYTGLE